jgi:hypothetical protein
MNPQPPSNDLAERFALIIDGLCKAVVTPQGPFRAVFFFFMRRRIQKELELIGQQFAHLIELLRAGKLTPAPDSDSPVDSDAASSPPASSSRLAPAVPTAERSRAVDWLYPADHEPGAGEGFWRTAPMADCHQPLAAGASGIAEEWVDLAPAPASAVHGGEHDRAPHHAAEAGVQRQRMIRSGEPRRGKSWPALGAAQFPLFPISAELASPRLAWRVAVRARPPDPGFFAGGFAPGVSMP